MNLGKVPSVVVWVSLICLTVLPKHFPCMSKPSQYLTLATLSVD